MPVQKNPPTSELSGQNLLPYAKFPILKPMTKIQLKTEIAAGLTTFFTVVYIVIVNPAILSTEGTGMPFSGVMTATVLLSFLMTLLMGVYAKLPFVVAPGMGVNALFTYTIVLRNKVPWQTALGIVFWAGVVFLICSLTPIRKKIIEAIPENLRHAAAAGIGLFLTFIGLRNLGLVIADPITFVRFGTIHQTTVYAFIGFAIMAVLLSRKNPFAFLVGIGLVTFLGSLSGHVKMPDRIWSMPDFDSVFLKLEIWGALKLSLLPSIVAIFFTDLFDSISTFLGCLYAVDLKDRNGKPLNVRQGLIVDAWATCLAGPLGTSAGTAYVESAAGMEVGGRTGVTAIVIALCFLPCLFLSPLAGVIPSYATAPVLILVGALMFRSVSKLKLGRLEELIPPFLTIVLVPLTFSITQGILWGLTTYVVLFLLAGRRREIPKTLYALSLLSIGLLMIENLHS